MLSSNEVHHYHSSVFFNRTYQIIGEKMESLIKLQKCLEMSGLKEETCEGYTYKIKSLLNTINKEAFRNPYGFSERFVFILTNVINS